MAQKTHRKTRKIVPEAPSPVKQAIKKHIEDRVFSWFYEASEDDGLHTKKEHVNKSREYLVRRGYRENKSILSTFLDVYDGDDTFDMLEKELQSDYAVNFIADWLSKPWDESAEIPVCELPENVDGYAVRLRDGAEYFVKKYTIVLKRDKYTRNFWMETAYPDGYADYEERRTTPKFDISHIELTA